VDFNVSRGSEKNVSRNHHNYSPVKSFAPNAEKKGVKSPTLKSRKFQPPVNHKRRKSITHAVASKGISAAFSSVASGDCNKEEELLEMLDPSYYYLAPLNIKELKELLCAYLPVVKFG